MADKDSNLHAGHRQRVFARYLETGFEGFSEHQIIEMMLFYAYPRRDQNERAHLLLEHFGSLSAFIAADEKELRAAGINSDKAMRFFRLISGLYTERFDHLRNTNAFIDNDDRDTSNGEEFLDELHKMMFRSLSGEPEQCFEFMLFYSHNFTPFYTEKFGWGVRSPKDLDLRHMISMALTRKAATVAVSRRRCMRLPLSEAADNEFVEKIFTIFDGLEILLADYVLVGDERVFSMRRNYIGCLFR